jgi:Skp family chaperone for outer membrane proteins
MHMVERSGGARRLRKTCVVSLGALIACCGLAYAQGTTQGTAPATGAGQSPAWFVPKAQSPQPEAAPPTRARSVEPQQAVEPPPEADQEAADAGVDQGDQSDALPQYNLPALAPLPPLPKTAPPPTAIVGVLGVPDVMRDSTASQEVQKVIGARRDKLAADYQKEQQVWRDLQQQLVNQRDRLSQAQLQQREQALQQRVATETKDFRARNRVIQEAGQISLAQIERVLVAVIRQVAESRGMNLVLHRQQVALNVAEFDITDEVTAQLNTLLPSVVIPPDGQEPTPQNTGGALQASDQTPPPSAAALPAGGPRATPN